MTQYAIYKNGIPFALLNVGERNRDANFALYKKMDGTFEYIEMNPHVAAVSLIPDYDATKVKAI